MNRRTGIADYRALVSRYVIGACLLSVAARGMAGVLPSQLLSPPLTNVHYDAGAWLFKLSGAAYFFVQNPATAALLTGLLILFGLLAFWFPLQRSFTAPFTLLYLAFSFSFTVYLTHNASYLNGFVWLLPVCWAGWRRKDHFAALWEAARYYACWIYASAFLLKAFHGGLFQWQQGELVAQQSLADYLFHFSHSSMAAFYHWSLGHPWLLNAGAKIVALAEGCFLIGFFTKRFDKLLLVLLILITASTYLFADVFFAELLVVGFTFFPERWWRRLWLRTAPKSIHHLLPEEVAPG